MLKTFLKFLCLTILLMSMGSCASQKNTASTRRWKSFKARYNTYFNAHQAYLEGMQAKKNGNKDNYTEIIPLLMASNKASQNLGGGQFETTVKKCEKTIKLYSIKTKPEAKRGRAMTPKEKAFRNRKEFNPFLKNAWILMGKAQMQQGQFVEAASTFAYTERLYHDQPQVANVARSLLALCYTELEWYYDAEELLRKVKQDSIPRASRKVYNTAMANLLLRQKHWEEALPYLRKEASNLPRGVPRSRGYFLLGQICQMLDLREEGYKAYQKCMRQSPPYEVKFNAQIRQTEVMPQGNYLQKIKKLKRMAKNPNNKNYLDQVYYAMGNVYLALPDTASAIEAYGKGGTLSSRGGATKAVLMLSLGDIYWAQERFDKAQRCYSAAVSSLNKENERYEELTKRNKVLSQLVPPTKEVFVQDSVQAMARMSEKERNDIIDKVIAFAKEKEKEKIKQRNDSLLKAQRKQARSNRAAEGDKGTSGDDKEKSGTWYFYNQQTVIAGREQFQRLWGNRPDEDNWQRINKEATAQPTVDEIKEAPADSLQKKADDDQADDKRKRSKRKKNYTDTISDGPFSRKYYLDQLPLTEEKLAASNKKLANALFTAGVIEKDQLENYALSRKTLLRLYREFPNYEKMDELLYHLFLLELHWGSREQADVYLKELAQKFPNGKYTALVTDPQFEDKARYGILREDSLYRSAYQAYLSNDYKTVESACAISKSQYQQGANRAKFIFFEAMTQLRHNDVRGFAATLRSLVKAFPKEPICELAKGIITHLEAGRVPAEGQFDLLSLWEARGTAAAALDSTLRSDTLQADRFTDHELILTYQKGSLDEGKLLYEVSRFNFTSFNIRNFDIEITQTGDRVEMLLKGFNGFDEVHRYQQDLFTDSICTPLLRKVEPIIISKHNHQLIGIKYSWEEYKQFYLHHFVPSKVKEELKIDQQPDNFIWDEFQDVPEKEKTEEEETDFPDDEDGGEWY